MEINSYKLRELQKLKDKYNSAGALNFLLKHIPFPPKFCLPTLLILQTYIDIFPKLSIMNIPMCAIPFTSLSYYILPQSHHLS